MTLRSCPEMSTAILILTIERIVYLLCFVDRSRSYVHPVENWHMLQGGVLNMLIFTYITVENV